MKPRSQEMANNKMENTVIETVVVLFTLTSEMSLK